jgi:hypothetical protein
MFQRKIFDNLTRVGDDSCDMSQRNLQNTKQANYTLDNFYSQCPMNKAIDMATAQPNVFFKGSQQVGINGCNIDDNSELKLSAITKPRTRISLYERQFVTVPYLGRGKSNPVLESQIQQGDLAMNRKSVNLTTEASHIDYRHYPLLPAIKSTVTNPSNLVEGVASKGWIRGGVPSRELMRDQEHK